MNTDQSLAIGTHINRIHCDRLRDACWALTNDRYPEFATWPAAITHHHNREGGLLQHTLEVTDLALTMAKGFPNCDLDILIAAALWHDLGKIWEYKKEGHWVWEQMGQRFVKCSDGIDAWGRVDATHHILTSAQEFVVAARWSNVSKATEDAVVHCILAHHGPVKEWGSPVAPKTIEALLLHQADIQSAHYGATR